MMAASFLGEDEGELAMAIERKKDCTEFDKNKDKELRPQTVTED
jgi:hypothetical protein